MPHEGSRAPAGVHTRQEAETSWHHCPGYWAAGPASRCKASARALIVHDAVTSTRCRPTGGDATATCPVQMERTAPLAPSTSVPASVLSRREAKQARSLLHEDVGREMAEIRRTLGGAEVRRIVWLAARSPLDECGHVYKDLDEVLRVLGTAGVAEVGHRLYPVANIRGTD